MNLFLNILSALILISLIVAGLFFSCAIAFALMGWACLVAIIPLVIVAVWVGYQEVVELFKW